MAHACESPSPPRRRVARPSPSGHCRGRAIARRAHRARGRRAAAVVLALFFLLTPHTSRSSAARCSRLFSAARSSPRPFSPAVDEGHVRCGAGSTWLGLRVPACSRPLACTSRRRSRRSLAVAACRRGSAIVSLASPSSGASARVAASGSVVIAGVVPAALRQGAAVLEAPAFQRRLT